MTCIADGSSEYLSQLNARLRRIDLLCKLLAPLFVSLLTTLMPSYFWATLGMASLIVITAVIEMSWIKAVYDGSPALAKDQSRRDAAAASMAEADTVSDDVCGMGSAQDVISRNVNDWRDFSRLPTFLSSISATFLYMTVLS